MASDQMILFIENMGELPYDLMYEQLNELYPKSKVDFVMYDMFGYEHLLPNDRMKRTDDQYKKDVRKRYGDRCIITGVRATTQVCHIVPFSESDELERYDVNNGILLRDDIHRLFDRHDLRIDPNTLIVRLSDDLMNSADDSCYHPLDGAVVDIPERSKHYLVRKYQTDDLIQVL